MDLWWKYRTEINKNPDFISKICQGLAIWFWVSKLLFIYAYKAFFISQGENVTEIKYINIYFINQIGLNVKNQ